MNLFEKRKLVANNTTTTAAEVHHVRAGLYDLADELVRDEHIFQLQRRGE